MKININVDDKDAISDSLRDIRMYIQGMYISTDENFIDESVKDYLMEYYRTEVPEVEAEYKKMLATAVIRSCNDSKEIPNKYKRKVGERMVKEFLECCDASKETYLCACSKGRYKGLAPGTQSSIQMRQKVAEEYRVVRKAQRIEKLKRFCKNVKGAVLKKVAVGTTVFKHTGSRYAAYIATTAATLVDLLLPKKVKSKLYDKAKKMGKYVSETVSFVYGQAKNELKKTPVGRTIVNSLEVLGEGVKEVATGIKKVATKVIVGTKNIAAKAWKSIKSWFC